MLQINYLKNKITEYLVKRNKLINGRVKDQNVTEKLFKLITLSIRYLYIVEQEANRITKELLTKT